ncbi:MAG TPA: T9SS type A sorting domain-containing protein [Puia sp.]|nr:T9SS type A sorting domain-containing protein [Puia sp.]
MSKLLTLGLLAIHCLTTHSQYKKMVVLGSSTAAGLGSFPLDSSWVNRCNHYYKYQSGIVDSTYNLGVSYSSCYNGMPSSFIPPVSRPAPDPANNVTKANTILSTLSTPSDGVVIVNYPTNGYDGYSIAEIMSSLQTIYDSAVRTGNKCYISTTQPRSDGNFATSAVKKKLADLKDSIINRFGISHSLDFWTGMFNPVDSTILTLYSAGDNVHFNNAGHRELFNRVVAKNVFGLASPPSAGDYRSVVTTGLWSDISTWQVFDGVSWGAATLAPTAGNGTITISAGDSIRINTATNFDQVVIESGAILAIFNTGGATTFTLNDGSGADIINNGKLYVSINATLSGAGTVQNNFGGTLILRNQGILAVNTTNNGTMNVSGTGNIQNATLTNNGVITLINFTLNLNNNASLINNDSISIAYNADAFIATTAGTGSFLNSTGAVIFKANATGIGWINASVSFTNNGTVKGFGQYNFLNTVANTGIVAPGNSPGILTVNPSFVTGQTPTFNLEINSAGDVAGVNYDQLQFSTVNFLTTNVTGATLNVTDLANDPVGTLYTVVSSPAGFITGPFAQVNLSPSLGNLLITANVVTLQKIAPLPLTWGDFTAVASNRQIILKWSTLQETNVDHFVIERSPDGQHFIPIGKTAAKGNSSMISNYEFTDPQPLANGSNYYRLQEVDLDGHANYSVIKYVHFADGGVSGVQIYPNPVQDILNIVVSLNNTRIDLRDLHGKKLRSLRFAQGTHQISLGGSPAGVYELVIYENERMLESRRIIKVK